MACFCSVGPISSLLVTQLWSWTHNLPVLGQALFNKASESVKRQIKKNFWEKKPQISHISYELRATKHRQLLKAKTCGKAAEYFYSNTTKFLKLRASSSDCEKWRMCHLKWEHIAHWRTKGAVTRDIRPPASMKILISPFCVLQGKGKMRTYWLLGEKTDVYVIWAARSTGRAMTLFVLE